MLRTIRKLLGEKSNQIKFPIALMGADAVLSIVLYVFRHDLRRSAAASYV